MLQTVDFAGMVAWYLQMLGLIPTDVQYLADGDTYDLDIAPVASQIGDAHVRMLAYNGSVPGPTLRVVQGSEIAVRAVPPRLYSTFRSLE